MKFSPIKLAAAAATAVLLADAVGIAFVFAALSAITICFIIYTFIRKELCIAVLAIIIGASAAAASYTVTANLRSTPDYIGRYVTLRGIISTSARESSTSDNYSYILKIKEIEMGDETEKVFDNIMLSSPVKLRCGDSVAVNGIIKDIPSQMNEYGFDTVKYYKSQNICARVFSNDIKNIEPYRIISPFILCGKFRDRVDDIIYRYYYGDSAAILSAVLTGNVHRMSADYSSAVKSTAFRRLLHPAFIHLMFIIGFIGLFSSLVPKKFRDAVLIAVTLLYALVSCANIGFTRCLIGFALMIFFKRKNGSAYYPDTLAWIVTVCCIVTPMILFNSGFVLSVAAGAVIWAFTPFTAKLFGNSAIGRTASVMAVCLVFYTPLTVYYYNSFCIYSSLAPFIMTPVIIVTLPAAALTLLLLSMFGTAPIVRPYLDLMLWIIKKLPPLISSLPFSNITVSSPSPSEMLTIICMLLAAYYILKDYKRKARYAVLFTAAFALSSGISAVSHIGTTDFTFVNVGQGDGSVIHTALGASVIIDGGGGTAYSDYNPGESIFVPYLESHGCSEIDAAFVSHFHRDHVQGVIAAVKTLNVKNLFLPPLTDSCGDDMKALAAELEETAKSRGTNICYVTENTRITFKRGLTIDIYVPDEVIRLSKDENDTSLLIKASYNDTSVLYTGDMSLYGEKEYMRIGTNVRADVLKVGHHGSKTSTCTEWINAVAPTYSVISCGENNSFGHPAQDTLNRLDSTSILRTDLNGDIKITVNKNGIKHLTLFKQ